MPAALSGLSSCLLNEEGIGGTFLQLPKPESQVNIFRCKSIFFFSSLQESRTTLSHFNEKGKK